MRGWTPVWTIRSRTNARVSAGAGGAPCSMPKASKAHVLIAQTLDSAADLGERQVLALHPLDEAEARQVSIAVSRRRACRLRGGQQSLRDVVADRPRRHVGE